MKRLSLLALAAAIVLTLAACGSSGSDSGKSGSDSSAKSDDSGSDDSGSGGGSSDCGETGDGVIRTFCDGSATVAFESSAATGSIGGGECTEDSTQGFFVVNAGTVIGPDFSGDKPDYAGFNLPLEAKEFSGDEALGSVTYGGETYVLQEITGEKTDEGATLSGSILGTGDEMSVTITC